MNNIDELIAKAADGVLTSNEERELAALRQSDSAVSFSIDLERRITSILKEQAVSLEQQGSVTLPSAPILQALTISTPVVVKKKKSGYYALAALGVVAVALSLVYVIADVPTQDALPSPAPTITTPTSQPSPIIMDGSVPAEHKSRVAVVKKDTLPKKHIAPKKPTSTDLDKDLPPAPVFTDPKGHMPINKR